MPPVTFDALPNEIKALRLALGWSRKEFGDVVGLSVNAKSRVRAMEMWEGGTTSPKRVYRDRMLMLVSACLPAYLVELRRINAEKADKSA